MAENRSPDNLNFALGVARSHITARDDAAKNLLQAVIDQCNLNPAGLVIHHLKARAELLSLYERHGTIDEHAIAFEASESVFTVIGNNYEWDRDKFQSLEVMEAGMQLAVSMLKGGYEIEAREMFYNVEEKLLAVFGSDDERTSEPFGS